ncbi:hypothetical protein SprV_0100082100 [Sparganum proliferum]
MLGIPVPHIRVRDPVLPPHHRYSPKTVEVEVTESLRLLLIHRPGLRSVQQRRQDDGLVYLHFNVKMETAAIPDCQKKMRRSPGEVYLRSDALGSRFFYPSSETEKSCAQLSLYGARCLMPDPPMPPVWLHPTCMSQAELAGQASNNVRHIRKAVRMTSQSLKMGRRNDYPKRQTSNTPLPVNASFSSDMPPGNRIFTAIDSRLCFAVESLAGFGDPVGHFIVDLGGTGESAAQVGEVVHDSQLGAVHIDFGCDVGSVGRRLLRADDRAEIGEGGGEDVHASLHISLQGGVESVVVGEEKSMDGIRGYTRLEVHPPTNSVKESTKE